MKKVLMPLLGLLALLALTTAWAEETLHAAKQLDVYYFHGKRRCPTCLAVETETRAVIETAFKKETDAGILKFSVLNLDDPASRGIAEQYGVWGSTLLMVDAQGQKTDLTDMGFRSARSKPEQFREELRAAIQQRLTPGAR